MDSRQVNMYAINNNPIATIEYSLIIKIYLSKNVTMVN